MQLALPRCASPHEVDNGQQGDRSQQGNEQARYAKVTLIDGRRSEEGAQEPTAQGRADDSDHYVEQNALTRSHDRARRPPDQSTDHEPDNDVHKINL
jgi:hypothetical protein